MNKKVLLALTLAPIVFLPACAPIDWLKDTFGMKKKEEVITIETVTEDTMANDGETLVSMGGKAIISSKSLERDFDQLLEENPQLKSVLPLMPDAKYNFLQGMVSQAVVDRYVADNGIDKKDEYQKEFKRMVRSVKRMLNTKYFSVANAIEVTDAEVAQKYEEVKDSMPELVVSRGGVKAAGVQFAKEDAARAFATKAKGRDLAKAAKEAGVAADKVRDFKLVNSQSLGIDNAVKNRIIGFKKFPAVEVVKGDDKNFWVVSATEQQETKYRPLEQVQAGLKQYIEKEKRMAMFDKEIGRLKDEYKVAINDDFFKKSNTAVAEQSVEEAIAPQAEAAKAA